MLVSLLFLVALQRLDTTLFKFVDVHRLAAITFDESFPPVMESIEDAHQAVNINQLLPILWFICNRLLLILLTIRFLCLVIYW